MKHIVTLTTSNPSHEHVSLRRRQSTTNFMVEAADEDQAVFRATAHFRKLGHYIHEAKIYKKKDQLNELAPLALLIPAAARIAKPLTEETVSENVEQVNEFVGFFSAAAKSAAAARAARLGIPQAASAITGRGTSVVPQAASAITGRGTSVGQIARDEILSHAVSLPALFGIQAAANKAAGKETSIGSIVQDKEFWANYAWTPGLSYGPRILNLTGNASKYAKSVADDVVANAIEKARLATGKVSDVAADAAQGLKSVRSTANDVVATALEKIRAKNLVPGRIDLPTKTTERAPYTELEPAIAPIIIKPGVVPQRVVPTVKPEVKPEVDVKVRVPDLTVGRADSTALAKPELELKVQTQPKIDVPVKVPVKVDTKPQPKPKPKPRRRFRFPSFGIGNQSDIDPGTLGQYRGLFPLYQFADFKNMQESAPMNAIGRILAKRKKVDKDNAENEKNKINMEPKLGGGKT